jgi:hypothetical protein
MPDGSIEYRATSGLEPAPSAASTNRDASLERLDTVSPPSDMPTALTKRGA